MNTRRSGTSVANVGQRRPQAQQPQNASANTFTQAQQMKPNASQPSQGAGPQKSLQPANPAQQNIGPGGKGMPGIAPVAIRPQLPQSGTPTPAVKPQLPATPQQQQVRPASQIPQPRQQQPQQGLPQMQKLTPQQQQTMRQQASTPVVKPAAPAPVPVKAAPEAPPVKAEIIANVVPQTTQAVGVTPAAVVAAVAVAELQQIMDDIVDGDLAKVVDVADMKEEVMNIDDEAAKKKPRWMANKGTFRVSKAEKIKRKNARFRKILQPKNALMILNEINGSTQYNFVEIGNQDNIMKSKHPGGFKAVTVVDGVEFSGTGVDKVTAKSNAAESAIKSIILKKILSASAIAKQQASANSSSNSTEDITDAGGDNNGDVEMEEGGEVNAAAAAASKRDMDTAEGEMVPWMHIASFALHKLFNSWEETGTLLRASSQGNLADLSESMNPPASNNSTAAAAGAQPPSQMPQRALPENAFSMHPVMLLNQMRPGTTHYKELDVLGTPPQILYSYECMVEGKGGYIGKGPNKKMARRNAAYAACQAILGLTYSAEILSDIAQSSEPRKMPVAAPKVPRGGPKSGNIAGGYFVRQSQTGGNMMGGVAAVQHSQDMSGGDGYSTGMDAGYQWY